MRIKVNAKKAEIALRLFCCIELLIGLYCPLHLRLFFTGVRNCRFSSIFSNRFNFYYSESLDHRRYRG